MTDLMEMENETEDPKIVVRLTTTAWNNDKGLYQKKSLLFLRRKCEGFDFLSEDADCIGAEEAVANIINLNDCKDGVYQVVLCNFTKDWETGIVDGYDYKLVPYEPASKRIRKA